ncbi:MAG TPA: hypothetical protein VFB32_17995 [Rudaea sp.]|nr:hypothetical protein [Rudaea sp.]
MKSPYDRLPPRTQFWLCIVLTVAMALCFVVLRTLGHGAELEGKLTHGIIALEMPWSTATAEDDLKKLGADGRAMAVTNTKLDFVFLILYPLAISLACALVARWWGGNAVVYGVAACWGSLAAMPFDAVEDVAILLMLDHHTAAPVPELATVCATIKFALVIVGLGYVFAGAVRGLVGRVR